MISKEDVMEARADYHRHHRDCTSKVCICLVVDSNEVEQTIAEDLEHLEGHCSHTVVNFLG